MYALSVEETFSSAHQLREYRGKCENLHGHNWRVVLSVQGRELNPIGLLVDFGDLKKILRKICEVFDHTCLNDLPPFTEINPSSENIAMIIAKMAKDELTKFGGGVYVESVTVYESENSKCTFFPER